MGFGEFMKFKYIGLITGLFLTLSFELGAMAMSDVKYKSIIKDLEESSLSADQLKGIRETLKKYQNKRPLAIVNTNIPVKRIKLAETLKASPKKGGVFGEFRPNRPTGDHLPTRKNTIYIHTAIENDDDEYIEYQDRINGANYLKNGTNMFDALLDIDIKTRRIIGPRPMVYKRTVYSGLAKDFSARTRAHRADVNAHIKEHDIVADDFEELEELSEFDEFIDICASRKIRWICTINKRNMKVRASPIAENLPPELMKRAEILIGYNFNTLAKASTVLGDEEAYKDVKEFMAFKTRIDTLSSMGLLTVVEDLKAEEDDFMLGIR